MTSLTSTAALPERQSPARVAPVRLENLQSFSGGYSGLLDASIRRIGTDVSAKSFGRWTIRGPGMSRVASVELTADWLSIGISMRVLPLPVTVKAIGSMLNRNARMDGCCRFAGQREPGRRQIVTDIPADIVPWDSDDDLDTLIAGTIADLNAALDPHAQRCNPESQAGLNREQLEMMFDEAGWPARAGEDDSLSVPLDVPGVYCVASVEADSAAIHLRVSVLPVELASAPRVCSEAVAVLLWLTSSRMRMIRATRLRRAMTLDVSISSAQADASALAHACAALSAALRACSIEAALIVADERLANTYLMKLGFSTPS